MDLLTGVLVAAAIVTGTTTENLALPELQQNQASIYVTHNEALKILDGVLQRGIVDRDLSTPPNVSTLSDGAAYIVAAATYAIAAVSVDVDTFAISGNHIDSITDDDYFEVSGSTGNDGIWQASAVVYNTTLSQTVITVTGDITAATADGEIIHSASYWNNHRYDIAHWKNGWNFYEPQEGWRAWVNDEDVLYVFNGVSWAQVSTGGGGGTNDHGSLLGLTDDDHTQYVIDDPANSSRNVIDPSVASVVPLTIRGDNEILRLERDTGGTIEYQFKFDNLLLFDGKGSIARGPDRIYLMNLEAPYAYLVVEATPQQVWTLAPAVGLGTIAPKAQLHSAGATILGASASENVDSDLGTNQVNVWLDETHNSLVFKVKYSSGTIKYGTVTLQ